MHTYSTFHSAFYIYNNSIFITHTNLCMPQWSTRAPVSKSTWVWGSFEWYVGLFAGHMGHFCRRYRALLQEISPVNQKKSGSDQLGHLWARECWCGALLNVDVGFFWMLMWGSFECWCGALVNVDVGLLWILMWGLHLLWDVQGRVGGLGSSTIFKKFNEPYAPS